MMDFEFSLHFGNDKTFGYARALDYASMFDSFTPAGADSEQNVVFTNNLEVLAKYGVFQKLKSALSGMNSIGITFRGKEVEPAAFFQKLSDIAECYQDWQLAENPEDYCDDMGSSCWGCRKLTGLILQHAGTAYNERSKYWYQHGAYINDSTWRINKEEIHQALADIVAQKGIDFCPQFQPLMFRRIVATLPTTIDLKDTKNWEKVFMDETVSNSKHWEPVNISHKSTASTSAVSARNAAHPESGEEPVNEKLRYIPETTFADIGGIDDIVNNIRSVIELPIKNPALYDHLGIKPYRGILLWGEPGNGKTLIAKAIAHEVRAHFIPVVGPDILNKNFGESEKNIRDIFDEAREMQPSIIFIDEIDSIAQTRLAGDSGKWYASIVNQFMSLMDGIREFGNITVIATTNRPDLLDTALLRPGRFDYKLEVRRPNVSGCKKVLDIATRRMPLADDVDLFSFAEAVVGYSAAEITFIVKEAAMTALRRSVDIRAIIRDETTLTDFSHIVVKMSDFTSSLVVLRRNAQYTKKIYSLKG